MEFFGGYGSGCGLASNGIFWFESCCISQKLTYCIRIGLWFDRIIFVGLGIDFEWNFQIGVGLCVDGNYFLAFGSGYS